MAVDGGLRQLFRSHLVTFDFSSIETINRGIPDSNYCCAGVEGWIEYKLADYWRVTIRPEQVGWAERRLAHGGRVFMAVRQNMSNDILLLYPGKAIKPLKTERIDRVACLGAWAGGPAHWDWEAVAAFLLAK